jgi:hypothetical protein
MFEELGGNNAFKNVILTTTMWDQVDEETGEAREKELKSKYWKALLERGSTTGRFMGTRESAFNLIDPLIDAANQRNSVLLQRQLVDIGEKLPLTSARQALFSKMEAPMRHREDLLPRIRNEIKRTDGDMTTLEPLQEEHQRLRNSLEATVNETRRPLGHRLLNITDKLFSRVKYFTNQRLRPNPSPTLTTDLYVSDPQSMDPESEENLPQADHGPITVVEDPIDFKHQFPIINSSFRTPLPKLTVRYPIHQL